MKKFLVIVFLCFSIAEATAQLIFAPGVVVYLGQKENVLKTSTGFLSIQREHVKGKGHYKYAFTLVKFDSKMNKLVDKTLANGEGVYGPFKPRLVQLGNKYWLIYADWDQKKSLNNIYCIEINEKTLETSSPKLLVPYEDIDLNQVKLVVSPSKNYCGLYISPSKKDFFLAAFDQEFSLLWKGQQRIGKASEYELKSVAISDEGVIYISSVYDQVAAITSYSAKGVATDNTLDFGGRKVHHVDLKMDAENKLYAAGTLKKNSKLVSAIFMGRIENGAIKEMKEIEIPEPVLDRLNKDGLAKNGGIKDPYLLRPELNLQQDGRFKLVLECKSFLGASDEYTAYGSLLIVDLDLAKDQFLQIPKYQVGVTYSGGYNSFYTKTAKSSITVFYIDHAENIDRELKDEQKVLRNSNDAALFAATIDNNGKITRKRIFAGKQEDVDQAIAAFMIDQN